MVTQFFLGLAMAAVGIFLYRQKNKISDPTGVIALGIILIAVGMTFIGSALWGIPLW